MNITKEVEGLNGVISITIEKADYESTVNSTLKDYRKKANVPGFRPGKVPEGLIKKMYWKAALVDEVNKLIANNLTQYLKDENLNILGEPLPNDEKQPDIDWDKEETFQFFFDIALSPEFDINLTKRNKLSYYKIKVSDEEIDKQVENYANRLGVNEAVEEVTDKDLVRGDFVQLDSEGNEMADGIKMDKVLFAVDRVKDGAVRISLIGNKVGNVVIFDPVKTFENRHEIGHMLNISQEDAEALNSDFKVTIVEILRFKPAEINEEFLTKIFGEESGIKTESAMREFIAKNMEENFEQSSNYKFGLDAKTSLIEKVKMDLPEDFLKRWLKAIDKETTAEQLDNDFPEILKDIRWQLISSKIIKDNNIEIKSEDVQNAAKEMARSQFVQYGLFNMSDEMLDNYAQEILKKEEDVRQLYRRVETDKVFDLIKSKVAIEEKEVTDKEFMELLNNRD